MRCILLTVLIVCATDTDITDRLHCCPLSEICLWELVLFLYAMLWSNFRRLKCAWWKWKCLSVYFCPGGGVVGRHQQSRAHSRASRRRNSCNCTAAHLPPPQSEDSCTGELLSGCLVFSRTGCGLTIDNWVLCVWTFSLLLSHWDRIIFHFGPWVHIYQYIALLFYIHLVKHWHERLEYKTVNMMNFAGYSFALWLCCSVYVCGKSNGVRNLTWLKNWFATVFQSAHEVFSQVLCFHHTLLL